MIIIRLAWQSLKNRWPTAGLGILSIALGVALLLGVQKIRTAAHESFTNTISGTDLIVGARGGDVQLLLSAVFRIGSASNEITWQSLQDIRARPEVDWLVPIALGDSHRGFRVVGTSGDYFLHFRYRRDVHLAFAAGSPFSDLFDAVIGADVASRLHYGLGQSIVLSHGDSPDVLFDHADKPFKVSGVLQRTGTPVDQSIYVSLEAIEAIHEDWHSGAPPARGQELSAAAVRQMNLSPRAVTAAFVGLKSRLRVLALQRWIDDYPNEPLTAVMPGIALEDLWGAVATAEQALVAVSIIAIATALIGMISSILATLNERRREMAILRSVGATPLHIAGLLMAEALGLAVAGAFAGALIVDVAVLFIGTWIEATYGLAFDMSLPNPSELLVVCGIVVAGALSGLLPAYRAYRLSLADGLVVRL